VHVRRGGHLNAAADRVDERTMLTRCERVRAIECAPVYVPIEKAV